MKTFIQAAQLLPHIAPDHQKRARRLFHGSWQVKIAIQIAIAPIHRIGGPQPVEPRSSNISAAGVGNRRIVKPLLSLSIPVHKFAGGKPILFTCFDQ